MLALGHAGMLHQHGAGCVSHPHRELRCDGCLANLAPYSIGTEILSGHYRSRISSRVDFMSCPRIASHTAIASRVGATSCTRTIAAPRSTANSAAATLANIRSGTALPV